MMVLSKLAGAAGDGGDFGFVFRQGAVISGQEMFGLDAVQRRSAERRGPGFEKGVCPSGQYKALSVDFPDDRNLGGDAFFAGGHRPALAARGHRHGHEDGPWRLGRHFR